MRNEKKTKTPDVRKIERRKEKKKIGNKHSLKERVGV